MDKVYKVGIFISVTTIIKEGNDKYSGRNIEIWKLIKKHLKKKGYNFKEIYIKSNNFDDSIDNCEKGLYDIIIGEFTITSERRNKVLFTLPLYISIPSMLVKVNKNINSDLEYFIFLIKNIYKPFIIIIFFALIPIIILNWKGKSGIKLYTYYILSGFLNQSGFLLKEAKNPFLMGVIFITILMIFTFFIYITSLINAKTIMYKRKKTFEDNNFRNKKIIVYDNTAEVTSLVLRGIVPVKIPYPNNKYNYFLQNKEKVDGIYESNGSYFFEKYKHIKSLYVSDYKDSVNIISFPINKKNKKLEKDINEYIVELQYNSKNKEIYNLCKKYNFSNPELCNFI
jgi:ABC-type amino acid transport substrate-binding protein